MTTAIGSDIRRALDAVRSFLDGEGDSDGAVNVDGMADYEPVTVVLNAATVRAVRVACNTIKEST